jgi:ABC-type glycerol-3-phosphate transport system permease component
MITSLQQRVVVWVLLSGCVAVFLLPLVFIASTSLKTKQEVYSAREFHFLPQEPTLQNYYDVKKDFRDFPGYCYNTAIVTVVTVVLVVIVSSLCGYALARLPFAGGGWVMGFLLLLMAVPAMVMLVPIYRMELYLRLLNTLGGLILPYTAMLLPMSILIMRSAFLAVPDEMREAAIVDGAGEMRAWWTVMLPIAKPSLTVVALLAFLSSWTEYTYAVTLNTIPSSTTLAVGVTYLKDEAQSWAYPTLSAVIMLTAVPMIAVFLFFQKRLVAGLSEGALKG